MFTWFKVVTNSYPWIFFMVNFGKLRTIHCILCVLIIVTNIQYFTFINFYFHLPLFWPTEGVEVWLIFKFFSVTVVTLLVICVSSANFDILQVRYSSISLTYIRKRMGHRIEPWSAPPLITSHYFDDSPFMTKRCFLPKKQSLSNLRIFPALPCDSTFFSSRLWGTLSNAFWKSR